MELLNAIKNFFLNINGENYINLISIIVVAITTYGVTKYSVLKPNKLKIKEKQLHYVYLPLYRLFSELSYNVSKENAITYQSKMSQILEDNYLLAFPELHELEASLQHEIFKNRDYNKILKIIKHQIDIDYELLKKTLGYPSANWRELFIRMTLKQKVERILTWANVATIFIPCVLLYPLAKISPDYGLFICIGIYLVSFFILSKLNSWARQLKD